MTLPFQVTVRLGILSHIHHVHVGRVALKQLKFRGGTGIKALYNRNLVGIQKYGKVSI